MEEKSLEDNKLQLTSLERDLANANREIEMNLKQSSEVAKKKEFLEREMKIVNEQTSLALQHWVFLNPTWEFEKIPKYMELSKAFAQLNFEKRMFDFNIMKEQISNVADNINEQRLSVEKHRDALLEKINELKGD